MDPKSKGLADDQEGDFILNESGTSVTIDRPDEGVEGDFVDVDTNENKEEDNDPE